MYVLLYRAIGPPCHDAVFHTHRQRQKRRILLLKDAPRGLFTPLYSAPGSPKGAGAGLGSICHFSSGVATPLLDQLSEVVRPFGIEIHLLARARMHKTQGLGMQRLPRTDLKAILHELLVFGGGVPSQDLLPAISLIGEQRVTYVFHVHAYLVRAPRLQPALHKGHVAETLQHPVVGDGMLGVRVLSFGEDGEEHPVLRVTAQIARDRPLVLRDIAPHQRIIEPFGRLVEELFAQVGLGVLVLGDDEQT